MEKLKEKILEDNQDKSTPSDTSRTGDPMPSVSSSTGDPMPSTLLNTTRSNDTYVYGVGMLAVLAIGVCVFFAYNTFQPKNKPVNEKQDQQPKRCPML